MDDFAWRRASSTGSCWSTCAPSLFEVHLGHLARAVAATRAVVLASRQTRLGDEAPQRRVRDRDPLLRQQFPHTGELLITYGTLH